MTVSFSFKNIIEVIESIDIEETTEFMNNDVEEIPETMMDNDNDNESVTEIIMMSKRGSQEIVDELNIVHTKFVRVQERGTATSMEDVRAFKSPTVDLTKPILEIIDFDDKPLSIDMLDEPKQNETLLEYIPYKRKSLSSIRTGHQLRESFIPTTSLIDYERNGSRFMEAPAISTENTTTSYSSESENFDRQPIMNLKTNSLSSPSFLDWYSKWKSVSKKDSKKSHINEWNAFRYDMKENEIKKEKHVDNEKGGDGLSWNSVFDKKLAKSVHGNSILEAPSTGRVSRFSTSVSGKERVVETDKERRRILNIFNGSL